MFHFIGHSTSNVVSVFEFPADCEIVTVGREQPPLATVNHQPSHLLLDSIVAPRMISRKHATITRQRQSGAAASSEWLLTDLQSMNGVFVNDVKIASHLLRHGDVVTFGGLGQKVPIGATFPQPKAEFIFRYESVRPVEDDATLPMTSNETLPVDETQAQTLELGPGHHTDDDDGEEEEEEFAVPIIPVERSADELAEEFAPTQLLPCSVAPVPATAAERPVSTNSSGAMMDIDTPAPSMRVIVTQATGVTSHAGPVRTDTNAPTQVLPLSSATLGGTQMMETSQEMTIAPTSHATTSSSSPSSHTYLHPVSVSAARDPFAIRGTLAGASLDVSMAPASLDTDGGHVHFLSLPTLDSGSLSSLSPSLGDAMANVHMMTQTQVLPSDHDTAADDDGDEEAKEAEEHRKHSRDELYDMDDDSPKAGNQTTTKTAVAAMNSSAAYVPTAASSSSPSPAAAASSSSPAAAVTSPVTSARGKKRGRDDRNDDDQEVTHAHVASSSRNNMSDDVHETDADADSRVESSDVTPSKKLKAAASGGITSGIVPTGACPICAVVLPVATLEAHVNACLTKSAESESESLARRMQEEENKRVDEETAASKKRKSSMMESAALMRIESKNRRRRGVIGEYDSEVDEHVPSDCDDDDVDEDDEDEYDRDCYDPPVPAAAPWAFGFPAAAAFGGGGVSTKRATRATKKKPPPSGPKSPCPLCSKEFHASVLVEHVDACEGPDVACTTCSKLFLPSALRSHTARCDGPDRPCAICLDEFPSKRLDAHMSKCVGKGGRECSLCSAWYPPSEYEDHVRLCMAREAELSLDEKLAIEAQRSEQKNELCNDTQLRAIQYVAARAKDLSQSAHPALLARFEKLGFSLRQLKQTIRYIRTQAPIIIHVNLTTCMKFFVKDTHYRYVDANAY